MSAKRSTESINRGTLLTTVLVFALVCAVGVLSFLALSKSRQQVSTAGEIPTASSVSTPFDAATETSPTPTTSSSTPSTEPVQISASTRVISAVDSQRAYRAITGTCPGGTSVIEVSSDGGTQWSGTDVSGTLSTYSISRIILGDGGSYVAAIGLDADCVSNAAVHSYTAGDAWASSPEPLSQTWYLAADGDLRSPGGVAVAAICDIVRLAPSDRSRAAIVCSDGTIQLTEDSGSTWITSVPVSGIDAITALSDGTGYYTAILGAAECTDGTLIEKRDGSLALAGQTCVPTGAVPAGSTALSQSADGTLWLWSGDSVVRLSQNDLS